MERMLAMVFDSKAKAYEGSDALDGLEENSVIAIYDSAVVTKDDVAPAPVVEATHHLHWRARAEHRNRRIGRVGTRPDIDRSGRECILCTCSKRNAKEECSHQGSQASRA